jgi:hypothetical protein
VSHVPRFDHVGTTVADLGQGDGVGGLALSDGVCAQAQSFIQSGELSSRSQERCGERGMQGMFVEVVPHARVALGAGTSSCRTPVAPDTRPTKSINTLEA